MANTKQRLSSGSSSFKSRERPGARAKAAFALASLDRASPQGHASAAGRRPSKAAGEPNPAPSSDSAASSSARVAVPSSNGGGSQGSEDEASGPIRVLLADDHAVVRAGISFLLQSLDGVEVVAQASNGHEVLRLLDAAASEGGEARSSGIDIAILDISMGGMNGLEAAAHIKRLHPKTRVIMLSMHDSEEYVKQALDAGAIGYLLKESGFNELELALRNVAMGQLYLSPSVSRHLAAAYLGRSSGGSSSSTSHGNPSGGQAPSPAGNAPILFGRRATDALPDSASGKASGSASSGEAAPVALTKRQNEILCLLAQGLTNGQIAARLSISIKTVETHRAAVQARLGIFDIVGLVRYALRHGLIEPL